MSPTGRINAFAQQNAMDRSVMRGKGFDHLVFTQNADLVSEDAQEAVLHVYLEGDGSPWRHRYFIMSDPTPRRALMLELMTLDSTPSVYVGRPCYNGTSLDEGCHSDLWTSGRYSPGVVDSMASVINTLASRLRANQLRLIGHSGGGALAMLIAPRIEGVVQVVTMGGNLDTDAWTLHHGYTPLYSSLNPARQAFLPEDVVQWHLLGARDAVIPPHLVRRFIDRQPNALGVLLEQFNHGCCWKQIWPDVIRAMQSGSEQLLPGARFKLPFDTHKAPINSAG